LARWFSYLVAWFYILLLPFSACFPVLSLFLEKVLSVVKWPAVCGKNIKEGNKGF
jgi:hypothetical protein